MSEPDENVPDEERTRETEQSRRIRWKSQRVVELVAGGLEEMTAWTQANAEWKTQHASKNIAPVGVVVGIVGKTPVDAETAARLDAAARLDDDEYEDA